MPELERDLFALAAHVDLPAERDLWPGIHARLGPDPRRSWRMVAAVAAAALAVALGVAFAVPPARSAILRFLGFEGVTIVRVEKLPPVANRATVAGNPTTLDAAAQRLGFRALLPDIGAPDAIYLDPSGQAVLLLYGRLVRPLRLEETRLGVFGKLVTIQQQVERVTVNGGPGIWVSGTHVVSDFFGQPRLSGSALIWEQDLVTLRLDGPITKAEALRIAGTVRAH
jgi:hypothetical protein